MDGETEFKVEERNGIPVVKIVGSLDHYNVPRFRQIITDLSSKGHNEVVVDMSEVDFMDSGGMSGIILGLKWLSEAGGRLLLADLNPRIMRKLEISGFTMMPDKLVLSDSVDQAVAAARSQ
ncbi:MAG TPA: STAS domain-containing protein [Armatimonadota bacterium]|nr:STAS domain-containing protein [Armatimonadota bacterium]